MIKYKEIVADIKDQILNGNYKPNEQLPFEKDLCEEYSASRMTVKKAVDLLVAEGLVVKRRGSGSFIKDITEEEIQEIIEKKQFAGLTNTCLGHEVTSKVLDFRIVQADEKAASKFKIDNDDFVYFIHRVRYVDGEPMVIERTYMPLSIAEGIKMEDVNGSIYNFLQRKLGLKIQSAHSTVRIKKAEKLDEENLLLMEGEPIAEVEKVVYLENGRAFEYSFCRHRYDKFEFKSITVL
jgi:GntR family transcriptional regulator